MPVPGRKREPQVVRTYADLIVDYLVQLDVDYVFGVPGGAIEPLVSALARRQREALDVAAIGPESSMLAVRQRRSSYAPKFLVARHESGAAFMAEGYSRETGKLGVCCGTTGPGSTNMITGVASAYADNVPLLVLTPQTPLPTFGRRPFQGSSADMIDIVGMFQHCTVYNSLVSHPNQLEDKLHAALVNAFRRPRGPAHLSVPMDILGGVHNQARPRFQVAPLLREPKVVDGESLTALTRALLNTKKLVMFLGKGCRGAMEPIVRFAELVRAPIVTTPAAKGYIDAYHPLYRGVFGFAGHSSANAALTDPEVELVLAVGSNLDELSTGGWDETALLNEKLIHIDSTTQHFERSPMARLHVYGDLSTLFSTLMNNIIGAGRFALEQANAPKASTCLNYVPPQLTLDDPAKCDADGPAIKPQRLMRELAQRLPPKTRFLSDAGNAWSWTTHYLHIPSPDQYRISLGFGAMTWAIGAAIGTAFGAPNTPVVCITGDGSFLMSGQELTVAVAEHLPVVFVILNDQALGMVKFGQLMSGAELIGYALPPIDFAAVARAMGAQGHTIRTPEDFAGVDFHALQNEPRPMLLDVHIDPEEVPPIGLRIRTLMDHQRDNRRHGSRRHTDRRRDDRRQRNTY